MYKALDSVESISHSSFFIGKISEIAANSGKECELSLPFFHTCKSVTLRDIFIKKEITPQHCVVFDKPLTYLFYGKPAYRLPSDGKTSREIGRFPVTFIVDLDKGTRIDQAFPFDTGALVNGYLECVSNCELNPAKYGLGTSFDSIKCFISSFYGTDRDYFHCNPSITNSDLMPFSFELQKVLSLITERSSKGYDNRAYTVELQIQAPIELSGNQVKAVFLPSDLMGGSDRVLDEFLYENDIDAITYTLDQADPAHMTTMLQMMAENYMKDNNIL